MIDSACDVYEALIMLFPSVSWNYDANFKTETVIT